MHQAPFIHNLAFLGRDCFYSQLRYFRNLRTWSKIVRVSFWAGIRIGKSIRPLKLKFSDDFWPSPEIPGIKIPSGTSGMGQTSARAFQILGWNEFSCSASMARFTMRWMKANFLRFWVYLPDWWIFDSMKFCVGCNSLMRNFCRIYDKINQMTFLLQTQF